MTLGWFYDQMMTRLVCFPARVRFLYGIGLLQASSGLYSSAYSGLLEFRSMISSGGVLKLEVV
jgi:hypothetical protein